MSRKKEAGHRRQLSEPSEWISAAALVTPPARRHLYERTCSSGDILRHSRVSLAVPDIATFQESWSTAATDFSSFAGTSTTDWASVANLQFSPKPSQQHQSLPSAIHDAARITDWNTVLNLCQAHPKWAAFSGRDGWTALHHAGNRRCPRADVVEALLEAYPEALLKEEEKGWLPLHYACRFKAPKEVVQLLLHKYPVKGKWTVQKRDRLGRTPLYYAVRYDAPPGVVGLLLQIDPSAVLEEDFNDDSPLALVWNSWADKLEGKRIVNSVLPGGFPEPEDISVEDRAKMLRERLVTESKLTELKRRWQKANMLLKAAFGFPLDKEEESKEANSNRKWRIVHATAAVKCHISLFQLACALHPEQVAELDQFDLQSSSSLQTALHCAASSNASGEAGKTVLITLLSIYRDAAHVQNQSDGSLPLHLIVENPHKNDWGTYAAILYHFYPRAVQISDHMGRVPLHRAAAALQHTQRLDAEDEEADNDDIDHSVVSQLVRLFPQAASSPDQLGLLPLHHAVKNACEWDDGVESIYNCHRQAVHLRVNGELPLHMAAVSPNSRLSMIKRLLELHPRASSLVDSNGRTALHLACLSGKDWTSGGVQALYEAHPPSLQLVVEAEGRWLPLHYACASKTNTSNLIGELITTYGEAARMSDSKGRYPLHLACASGFKPWDDGLNELLKAHPIVTSTPDASGCLPFHIAALRCCGEHSEDDEEEEEEPAWLVEAKALDKEPQTNPQVDLDVLFQLLRADPSVLR